MRKQPDPKEQIIDDFITAAWQNDVDIIDDLAAKHPWLVDRQNPYLTQALHTAANSAQQDSARVLVEKYGADVNARHDGSTALHAALNSADMVTAKMLIANGADIDARDGKNGFTDGWTPLHYAVSSGDAAIIRHLLKRGADSSIINDAGETPVVFGRNLGTERSIRAAELIEQWHAATRAHPVSQAPKRKLGGMSI